VEEDERGPEEQLADPSSHEKRPLTGLPLVLKFLKKI